PHICGSWTGRAEGDGVPDRGPPRRGAMLRALARRLAPEWATVSERPHAPTGPSAAPPRPRAARRVPRPCLHARLQHPDGHAAVGHAPDVFPTRDDSAGLLPRRPDAPPRARTRDEPSPLARTAASRSGPRARTPFPPPRSPMPATVRSRTTGHRCSVRSDAGPMWWLDHDVYFYACLHKFRWSFADFLCRLLGPFSPTGP